MSGNERAEWQFGKEHPGGFRVHRSFEPDDVACPYSISWDQQWLDGAFATVEEALASGHDQIGDPSDHFVVQPSDWGGFTTPDGGCVECGVYPPNVCRVFGDLTDRRP